MYGFEVEGGCVFYKFRDMDGSYSLTDEHLQWFWETMKKGGQISTVFYDGCIDSFPQFLALAKMKDQHFFLGFKDDVPAILFWVNGLASRSCYVHFSIMPRFYGPQGVEMAQGGLRHMLSVSDVSGEYIFDCIKALIPVRNPLACRMAIKTGFTQVGVMPKAVYWADEDQSVDGVIFCAVRYDEAGVVPLQ